MKLDPEYLAAVYSRLRRGPVFRGLKLPPRGAMVFRATQNKKHAGYFRRLTRGWAIAISEQHNATDKEVEATMAHEMIHAHLHLSNPQARHHGPEFQRLADKVCARLGYDRRTF